MNIVFWALVALAGIAVWFALSPIFWDIGEFISSIWNDAKEAMTEAENDQEDE